MSDIVNIKVYENTPEGMLAAIAAAETRLAQKIDDALIDSTLIGNPNIAIPAEITGNAHCIGVGPGTYAFWGGMVVPANNIATLRRVNGEFFVSLTSVGEINKMLPWVDGAYPVGTQRNHLGKDWYLPTTAAVLGDVPGTSSKWVERLTGYNNFNFKRNTKASTISFQGFPNSSLYSYNSATGAISSTAGNFSTVSSSIELDNIVINNVQWIQIGSGTNYSIVVSIKGSSIGQLSTISSGGALVGVGVKFPTTGLTATYVKIDVSTDDVIIYGSADNIAFTEWGRCAKASLGVEYYKKYLGILNTDVTTVRNYYISDILVGTTTILPNSVIEKSTDNDDYLMLLNSNEPSGVKKQKRVDFENKIKSEVGVISFKAEPATLGFISSSGGTASYNSTTGVLTSTPQAGETYTCAISNVNLNNIIITPTTQWVCIGVTDRGDAIIVSIFSSSIGQVRTISSAGALVGGTVKFPTTAVNVAANRLKINTETTDIIISYSLDAGVTYTEWGRCSKATLGVTYGSAKLGCLNISTCTVYDYTINQDDVLGNIIDGSTVPLTTSPAIIEEYIALINNKKTPGMRKISPANLLISMGVTPTWTVGKSAVLFGDSITAEVATGANPSVTGSYTSRIQSKLKLTTVTKKGYSGFSIGIGNGNTLANDTYLQQITDLNPDLIIMFAGTNDYGNVPATPLGLSTSSTTTETAGALHYIIKWFQKKNPSAQFVYCTPIPRTTHLTNNALGYNLYDLVKVVKEVCAFHSVPVCDLFSLSGIGYTEVESTGLYLQDGLHPKDLGYEKITSIQANFIKGLR